MADELDNELNNNQPSEVEKRIKSLSGKVKEEADLKERALADKVEAENKTTEANRKVEFLTGFTDVVSKNPAAGEFKSDIESKVLSGMSLEDATYAVLGKAGKLNQVQDTTQTAGGSATTTIPNGGTKTVSEMSQAERRSALESILEVS